MYILSWLWRSPGIEPRTPTKSGSSAGLQTSIVAHSSRECSSAFMSAASPLGWGAGDCAATAASGTAASTARPAARARSWLPKDMG